MTVPPPLTALGAFPIGLHGFYHCRPVGRRNRENKGSQNVSIAFWFILNKRKEQQWTPSSQAQLSTTLVLLPELASKGFY